MKDSLSRRELQFEKQAEAHNEVSMADMMQRSVGNQDY